LTWSQACETPQGIELKMLGLELYCLGRMSVQKAIRIGELLTELKPQIKKGEWGEFLNHSLPFSDSTAWRYMELHRNRESLESLNVRYLTDEYKLVKIKDLQASLLSDETIIRDMPNPTNDFDELSDLNKPKAPKSPRRRAAQSKARERCEYCGRFMTQEILKWIAKGRPYAYRKKHWL